jgi:hypothetical protein
LEEREEGRRKRMMIRWTRSGKEILEKERKEMRM